MPENKPTWSEYRALVIDKLENMEGNIKEIKNNIQDIDDKFGKLQLEVNTIKTSSKTWTTVLSLVAGSIPTAIYYFFKSE